jgi:penicillin-binding protein 1A
MASISDPSSSGKRNRRLPLWLWLFFGCLVCLFAAVGAAFGILLGYEYNLPQIQSLEDYRPDVITGVYSDDNKVIGEFAIERRIIVSFEDIPQFLQMAILAAEDSQFYNHSGINYFSNIRAAYRDIIQMRMAEGASTITQQLARMLLGNYEKTADRKIKELLIAWKIESKYSKQQILTLYCNQHNMGRGIYGVAAAAESYFGKQLKDLTLEECALIAGLPRNPTLYSPVQYPDSALRRRNWVLDRMVSENNISAELAAEAKAKPIVIKRPAHSDTEIAPHFVEWVRESLTKRFSTDEIWRKGLQVYTTLNIRMQQSARKALQEGLRDYDKKRGWRGPIDNVLNGPSASITKYVHPTWRRNIHTDDIVVGLVEEIGNAGATVRIGVFRGMLNAREIAWTKAKSVDQILKPGDLAYFKILSIDEGNRTLSISLEQRPEVEGAIIILQNSTGEIKAMVGGYDFESSEFNRATQALRQVGSTFKPLVYSAAFEQGMNPDTTVLDAPISFKDGLGRLWQPRNYDGKFKGEITIRQALTESRNVPTIKIASLIGIKNVVTMARRFGIKENPLDPYLPLALGACEVTPLKMASAFTVFPNLGMRVEPYFIRKVEDYDRVKKEESRSQKQPVLRAEIAEQVLDLLQNVVQNGTATAAKTLGRPLGGKTGTTDDFTDAWFVGFTPSLTAAVWVGFDEKKTLGDKQSGAVVALPIWIECMKEILKDQPIENFASAELSTSPTEEAKRLYIENLPGTPAAGDGAKTSTRPIN